MTNPRLGAIALAPALVPGREGSYAFPRRFKIDVMDREVIWVGGPDGKRAEPQASYAWREVVNWMEEDFPDPGSYPVFFHVGDTGSHQVRLTLLPDSASGPYCALGELYLFRNPEKGIDHLESEYMGHLGDNMMAWSTLKQPVEEESYALAMRNLRTAIRALDVPEAKLAVLNQFMIKKW